MHRSIRAATAAFMRSPLRRVVGPLVTPIDRLLFRVSRGRLKLSAPMIPSLMLFSTGAKSGLTRETPLMCFPQPDGTWFIAGSNFGYEKHPAWSYNLIANPRATIHYRNESIPVTAALLAPDETDAVWPRLDEQWPGYRDYEITAKRGIRVFRLERE
jgi:deazaflavin-dependent oxidoreductase (nitroreductase family)